MTRPTGGSGRTEIIADIRQQGGKALICLVGVQSTSSPAPSISRARSSMPGSRSRSAASMSPAASPCCPRCRRKCARPCAGHLDLRRRGRRRPARRGAARRLRGHAQADLQLSWTTCRRSRASRRPILPAQAWQRTAGRCSSFDLGRGCPFQCSFCTIINVQGRKSRFRSADDLESDRARELRAGHHALLHHRRQFRPQQALGGLLRPADRAPGEARASNLGFIIQVDTLCHKIPNFIEKAQQGRRVPRLHRAREHQPRQPARRQEAPEQDHRIPQDAAGVARPRRLTYAGYILGFPGRHARNRSCAISRSSSASCRSTSSSSSSSRRCPAPRTTRPCWQQGRVDG